MAGTTEEGQSTCETHETVKAPSCCAWVTCATSADSTVLHEPSVAMTVTCSHVRKDIQRVDPACIAFPLVFSDVLAPGA